MARSKLCVLLAALIFLSGCATTGVQPTKVIIRYVEIPIDQPCKVEMPPVPEYRFDTLTEDHTIYEKTQALLADRLLHLSHEIALVAALDSCRK